MPSSPSLRPRRPVFRTLLSSCLAIALTTAQPAVAQDFFDWLEGSPPKEKENTFQGDVPTPVERGTLPDLSPSPGPENTQGGGGVDSTGEPVPRGPDGQAYGNDGQTQPSGPAQFDPLESRRARSEGGRAAPSAPSPQAQPWQNPDRTARSPAGERYAPGTFEDEQSAPPRTDDARQSPTEPAPRERQQGMIDDNREGGGFQQRRREPAYNPSPQDQPRGPATRTPPGGESAASGSYDAWANVSIADLEQTFSKLDLPPHSPVIHSLWLELITAQTANRDPKFAAVRADALNRTGLVREASQALAQAGDVSADPIVATLAARTAIGAGQKEQGCEIARSLTSAVAAKMPPHLKGEVILIAGFCAAAADNKPAAGIAADLATENGLQDHAGPAALKAISTGAKPSVERGKKVSLLDYRILQMGGPVDISFAIPKASPALLAVLARDSSADAATRLAAAEAAANLNAIAAEELAAVYRESAGSRPQVELSDAAANSGDWKRHAELFAAAEAERTPARKARIIRAFLDEARRAGFYWPALQLMAKPANDLQPVPEIGWFAETAIEASLAGGNFSGARSWANFAASQDNQGRADLRHWVALADIADPNAQSRDRHLNVVEDLAQHGRLDAALLHRLATVLDALDIAVPMPLWEAASRTEQPAGGHLPDTGVLSQLQDAAKKRDFTQIVLLTMRTIGPNGADGAHMIALGDSIRALKRAGLDGEARKLALEALFPAWPRANNS